MNLSLLLFGVALVVCAVFASEDNKDLEKQYSEFKNKHGKHRKLKIEDDLRKEIFRKNQREIEKGKNAYKSGENSHDVSPTEFDDLTDDEKSQSTGFQPPSRSKIIREGRNKRGVRIVNFDFGNSGPRFQAFIFNSSEPMPASVDWRTTGWNEPVQNQGQCGCCWSFSSTSVFSQYIHKINKVNFNFSQQHLIDCASIYGTGGCNGGSQANAFQYIQKFGQVVNTSYPYTAKDGVCNSALLSTTKNYTLKGFCQVLKPDLSIADHDSLKQAVSLGAVTVGIHVNGSFYNYKSGIYTGINLGNAECDPNQVNHAVTVIGYGTNATTNQDFWLIKNSWGAKWGEGGYFKLARSSANTCGIYNYAYNICQ